MSAAPLAAQYTDPLQGALAKLDATNRYIVEAIMDSAAAENLPVAPLRSRVLEGVQLKASAGRIVDAVRKKFINLRLARVALGAVSNEELDAGSAVLESGGKPTQLQSFQKRQKGRDALEAFTVWTDLINRGVPGEEASSAITKLWLDGADDATFRSLWNNVQTDISLGLNPGAALQARIRETPGRTAPKPQQPEGPQENERSR